MKISRREFTPRIQTIAEAWLVGAGIFTNRAGAYAMGGESVETIDKVVGHGAQVLGLGAVAVGGGALINKAYDSIALILDKKSKIQAV